MSTKTLKMKMSPKQLFRSISGFKYQLHQALGDLADNSVDAECTKIWISVSKSEIIIADNGDGMSLEVLSNAITPWATNEGKHRSGKRGVYGIGLKSAAFSLGQKLEVHTKAKGSEFLCIKLNHQELIERESVEFPYTDEVTDLFQKYRLTKGTVIRIKDIYSRKITQPAVDKLKGEIGLMFFRLIESNKISILINDEKVEPLHPLLIDLFDDANSRFKVNRIGNDSFTTEGGDPGNFAHDYKRKKIKFQRDDGSEADITIHGVHIARGSHWSNSHRNKYRYFLKKNVTPENELQNGLLKLDEQGIYLMRNDRLITLGGWLGIHRANTLLHHDVCCRVLIEYHSEDDEVIGVDHTKTKPDLLPALKDAIRDQYLSEVSKDSEERFRQEGKVLTHKRQVKKASEELKSRPRTSTEWSKKAGEAERLKAKIDPEYKRRTEKDEEEHDKKSKEKDDWLEVVEKLPFDCLWAAAKNKEGKTIVSINERHPGYSNLYHEYGKDKLRRNLNLFFYYMGQFEVDVDSFVDDLKSKDQELLKRVFKEFRKFVSRQLRDNEDD